MLGLSFVRFLCDIVICSVSKDLKPINFCCTEGVEGSSLDSQKQVTIDLRSEAKRAAEASEPHSFAFSYIFMYNYQTTLCIY